ncbi:type II secretion system F family protein [Pengzhenrongella sicca]|uniref:Type II secretion system F family protein n=1 Tax=Pengzhenrongella sicca TaxID=2819238 RepID=A0A8A4ZCQ2_9MICO|nr:type II secretion system F family protein [Pengzhenrongella sicca]QTE29712.1 type II secretion system F family protein [Pengzhenrongella sicca]
MRLFVVVTACLLGAGAPWAAVRSRVRLRGLGGPLAARRDGRRPSAAARRGRPGARPAPARLDLVVLLDLVDVAIASGASLPRAVGAVGQAADAEALVRAASALTLGADWSAAWSGAPAWLAPLVDGLAPTWATGATPGPALRATADRVRRARRVQAREAAGRLGVLLVLPLGLCFLPAFVLIGLVPVIASLAAGVLG